MRKSSGKQKASTSFMLCIVFATQLLFADDRTDVDHPLKYEEPRVLTGRIYAKGAQASNLVFTFNRSATRTGMTLNVLREYKYPDGKLAARERVVYEGDNLVFYELEELQIGARGRAEIRRAPNASAKGRVEFEYSKNAASERKPERDSEALEKDTLVNDMVGPFLVSHWEALNSGREQRCRYIVVPRRETVGFTFRKQSESMWQGRPVIIVKMSATSPVIAALVDPLFFTIEKSDPHRVFTYVGRTTPKIQSGRKWKDLDALTVFDWETR
jgi:hypothetical protein